MPAAGTTTGRQGNLLSFQSKKNERDRQMARTIPTNVGEPVY